MKASSPRQPRLTQGLFFAAAALAFLSLSCDAAVITLQNGASPTGEYAGNFSTFIRSDNPTTNYDNYNANSSLIMGRLGGGSNGTIRGLFSFDLSAIPEGVVINSVSLTLTVLNNDGTNSPNATSQVDVVALTAGFTSSAATWVNSKTGQPWISPGGDFSPTVLSSLSLNPRTIVANSSHVFASSSAFVASVQSAYDSESPFSFALKLNDEADSARAAFFLRGDADSTIGYRPSLTIDYAAIPEPTTAAFFVGGIGLAAIAMRRKRACRSSASGVC